MDDFLYFLLLIGWLGYSFYKQSEKKKKLLAQKKAAESEPVNPSSQNPEPLREFQEKPVVITEPDFAKTLEEILLGKTEIESLEEIPENEVQSLETIPEPVNQYADLNKKEGSNQNFWYNEVETEVQRTTTEISTEEPESIMIEEDSALMSQELHHFNLRSAVVYSEILNRKYS